MTLAYVSRLRFYAKSMTVESLDNDSLVRITADGAIVYEGPNDSRAHAVYCQHAPASQWAVPSRASLGMPTYESQR